MPEQVEMPDTMEVMRAMRDPAAPGRHARYHARGRDGPRRLGRRDATPGFQEVMFGLSPSYGIPTARTRTTGSCSERPRPIAVFHPPSCARSMTMGTVDSTGFNVRSSWRPWRRMPVAWR